jgi:hypothetical protein
MRGLSISFACEGCPVFAHAVRSYRGARISTDNREKIELRGQKISRGLIFFTASAQNPDAAWAHALIVSSYYGNNITLSPCSAISLFSFPCAAWGNSAPILTCDPFVRVGEV